MKAMKGMVGKNVYGFFGKFRTFYGGQIFKIIYASVDKPNA